MRNLFIILFFVSTVFGQVTFTPVSPATVEKFEQIIDVRIPVEREEIGVMKGAHMIEFTKDKQKIWSEISSKIDTTKPFAIICRSGKRSTFVAELIDAQDLNITVLDGGMRSLVEQGYITIPYKK